MNDLNAVLSALELKFSVKYLRGKGDDLSDVDYYLWDKGEIEDIDLFLRKNHFFKKCESESKINYIRFAPGFEMIDFELSFSYIFENWVKIKFNDSFIFEFLNDPAGKLLQFNTIRYLFTFKNDEKSKSFFRNNKDIITENNFFVNVLNYSPFKRNISFGDLNRLLNGNIICMYKYFKIKHFIKILYKYIISLVFRINSGKIIIFIGCDGSGKTTIIDSLSKIVPSKIIYMGSNEYLIKNLKNWQPNKFTSKALKFFLVYIEEWIKTFKMIFFKIKGWNVLIDRHPSYQFFQQKRGLGYYLSHIFYKVFFYIPKRKIILFEVPKIIHKRKQEKTIEEIDTYYNELKAYTFKDNFHWIKNSNINETLLKIYEFYFNEE